MGRIAATLSPTASVPSDGGLLLDPTTDLWADWGLLGVPDPDRATTTRQGLLFHDFIRSAFPTFQLHRLLELLIDLLQQVADGQLTRLIVCCPASTPLAAERACRLPLRGNRPRWQQLPHTRHSFQQIGERNPTVEDLSHPAWQWEATSGVSAGAVFTVA